MRAAPRLSLGFALPTSRSALRSPSESVRPLPCSFPLGCNPRLPGLRTFPGHDRERVLFPSPHWANSGLLCPGASWRLAGKLVWPMALVKLMIIGIFFLWGLRRLPPLALSGPLSSGFSIRYRPLLCSWRRSRRPRVGGSQHPRGQSCREIRRTGLSTWLCFVWRFGPSQQNHFEHAKGAWYTRLEAGDINSID